MSFDEQPDGDPHGECAAEIKKLEAEITRLRAFAQRVMEAWPHGDLDGAELQDIAVATGMLRAETWREPCRDEGCICAEAVEPEDWADGVTCYRRTPLLTEETGNPPKEPPQ